MNGFIGRVIRRIKWQFYLIGVSDVAGKMIRRRFKNRIPVKNGLIIDVSSPYVTNRTAATIYWGAYEKNELAFISKYPDTSCPTIELGSSIGVTGVYIARRSTQPIYCIEANPDLIGAIEQQFQLNKLPAPKILNVAVSTSSEPLYLQRAISSDAGFVVNNASDANLIVESMSLGKILAEQRISGPFNLVCDIEGSELDLFVNDPGSLENCRTLVIELHRTVFEGKEYQLEDVARLIEKLGFRLLERKEEVFAFSK